MNVNIRTSECAWAHTEIMILGRKIKGLRGFEFKKAKAKESIYGSGGEPIDIQEGNVSYTGSIKILGFELDALNRAAQAAGYNDIVDVPHEAIVITCSYQKTKLDKKVSISAKGVAFTEVGEAMEQDAKMREITLPLVAMNIKWEVA